VLGQATYNDFGIVVMDNIAMNANMTFAIIAFGYLKLDRAPELRTKFHV